MASKLPTLLTSLFTELRHKGWRYWVPVLVLVIVGTLAGLWLGERYVWIRLRYSIYGKIQQATRVNEAAKDTVVVLIDDHDYWKGDLARRVPLKRDYLAKLLIHLAKNEPKAIALDIDLRSPIPEEGSEELAAYREETELLLKTIKEVSQSRPIVLATTVTGDEGGYSVSPNVFDGYDFDKTRVTHGYVTLPNDLRQVPLAVSVKGRPEKEDSFAGAIAKIKSEPLVLRAEQYEHRGFPYGNFYRPGEFKPVSAGQVLAGDPKAKESIQGQLVIVGGAWHTGSYKGTRDDYSGAVDLHFTPAGDIPGAFVHANYVEALLNGSVSQQVPEAVALIIEILCSLLVAVVFALEGSLLAKFSRVLLLSLVLVIISYVLWQNVGLFFDFFIPILLLSFHAPIEQLRETRGELRKLRERVKTLEVKTGPAPTPAPAPANTGAAVVV
jgi:CHASE2 domain-containing sensor protein